MVVVTALHLACGGCNDQNPAVEAGADRQLCLGAELQPIYALAACSRFIRGERGETLKRPSAFYNRGVAFEELGELQHARLDFDAALKLEPGDHWARQRLDNIEEMLKSASD